PPPPPPRPTLFPYTRSSDLDAENLRVDGHPHLTGGNMPSKQLAERLLRDAIQDGQGDFETGPGDDRNGDEHAVVGHVIMDPFARSEEHTSELQSRENLVCRL